MTSGSGPATDPPNDPDMCVRLGAGEQPSEAACQMAEIGRRLPGTGEVTECGIEAAGAALVGAPGQGEPARGHPAAGHRQVDLVLGEAKQDPGVGSQRTE